MKVALITGASRGLGAAWCEELGRRGYQVIVSARNEDAAVKRADELRMLGLKAHPLELDVASEESIRKAMEWTGQFFGQLDLLVNNAGVNPKDYADKERAVKAFRLDQLDFGEMEKVYRINSLGPLMMVKHFRPLLSRSSKPLVVNMSSWLSSVINLSFGGHYGYVSSKNLLNILNKGMAYEIQKDGIISVNINPGWVKTDMGGAKAKFSPLESVQSMLDRVIDKLTPEDSGSFFNYDGEIHPW